ncbi:MAG: transcription elongation factor GreA [Candidatus Limnocylindrales bacterium]
MPSPRSAVALLRSLDLMSDGPTRWGEQVRSREPGVLLVEMAGRSDEAPIDITAVKAWIERVPGLRLDGERPTPTQLAQRLASFWLPQQTVLYVGRTAKSLSGRAASLFATPLGDRRPHSGGHWLWTLTGRDQLRIWWAETPSAEEYEDGLFDAIAADLDPEAAERLKGSGPVLPWANLTSATGDAKRTGITGSMLAEGEAPATEARAVATQARPSASSTRRAPASRATSPSRPRVPRVKTSGPPPNAPPAAQLTASGLSALQQELAELTTVKRPEVILRVKHARELGDLRENADYEAARREQSFLEGRIQEIEQTLRNAVVIRTRDSGVVQMGSRVEADVEGERATLHIVGPSESDPAAGRISDASPVGKALIGRRAGDEVVVQTPGRQIRYRVIEVSAS